MSGSSEAGLYGLKNLNKDLSDPSSWGKNQFNNLFPIALCCYMRDENVSSPLISASANGFRIIEESVDHIFGTEVCNSGLYFSLESKYLPFERFVADQLESIDVVIMENETYIPIRPLEIKLTTLPDDTTKDRPEEDYGSELVIRDKTTRYMALSIAESCEDSFDSIQKLFNSECNTIRDWDNIHEVAPKFEGIAGALNSFIEAYSSNQRPILLQPIWKTVGQSSVLAPNCIDIFSWTDFALAKMFLARSTTKISPNKITRPQRAVIRLVRFLWEVSQRRKVYQAPIYDGMTYNTLNDKELSISGNITNQYMRGSNRLMRPYFKRDVLSKVILGGGEKYLSPERRFDAVIYYTIGSLEN